MTEEQKPMSVEIPDLLLDAESSAGSRRALSQRSSALAAQDSRGVASGMNQQSSLVRHSCGRDLADDLDDNPIEFELLVTPNARAPQDTSQEPWPIAATPVPASIPINTERLAHVTPFGEPPRRLLEAPIYALLVYRDQLELKRKISRTQSQLVQIEAERDRVLGQWIDTIRPQLSNDERVSRLLARLVADESELQNSASDASRFAADVERDRQALSQTAEDLRARLQAATRDRQTATARLAEAEHAVARAEAARKRAEIEARAGDSLPAASRRGPPIPDADSALRVATEQLDPARQRSEQAELSTHAIALELRQIEDRLARAERIGIERTSRAAERQKEVARALADDKAEIGRMVLTLHNRNYIDDSTLEQLLRLDTQITSLASDLQHLVLALDAFDRAAVKRGLWLMIVALGLGILGVLLDILR